MDRHTTIVGYFAATKLGHVACDGSACIIAGSYKTMKDYLAKAKTKMPGKFKITKTRFGEILSGMRMGGAYSFDEESYVRFLPLAREEGMELDDLDFTPDKPGDIKFVTIARTNQ